MRARYLVTGATGFLGAHLVSNLLENGNDVVAFSRSVSERIAAATTTSRQANGASGANGTRPARGRRTDVAGDVMDEPSLVDAMRTCDGVFHLAGFVSRRPEDAERLYKLHVGGTRVVVEACKRAGVRRMVIASTSGTVAVGRDPEHVAVETDDTPMALLQRWPYYRAKVFAERAALEAADAELDVVSVNPTLLLGPGDLRGSSTEDVRLFMERKIPFVPSGGIAFVDVRDAAEAMRLAMLAGRSGERYLVNAVNLTLRAFFARLERESGVKGPWIPSPKSPEISRLGTALFGAIAKHIGARPLDPMSADMAQYFWYADASRAEHELGWQSRDPSETLADTVADMRTRGVVWPEESTDAAGSGLFGEASRHAGAEDPAASGDSRSIAHF
jgi:dihydroflavonol-4-reductase